MSEPMISLSNVSKHFGALHVLKDVSFDIPRSQVFAFIGPSGAGKSTLVRALNALENIQSGEIFIDGIPVHDKKTDINRLRTDIGFVAQSFNLYPHLNVLDNVTIGLELPQSPLCGQLFGGKKRAARARAAEMLEKVGLSHALDKYPAQLSGGMQQRLAIAQAFIMQPRVLLLDEPFGALDPGIRKDMHALLLQLWSETRMTVFMVTHDLSEGFNLGTRLLVFDKVRVDPHAPNAFGARITYDIPLNETRLSALSGTTPDNVYALRG